MSGEKLALGVIAVLSGLAMVDARMGSRSVDMPFHPHMSLPDPLRSMLQAYPGEVGVRLVLMAEHLPEALSHKVYDQDLNEPRMWDLSRYPPSALGIFPEGGLVGQGQGRGTGCGHRRGFSGSTG